MTDGHHHLVLLPVHGPSTVAEALAAMERLERAGALDVVGAVVLERREDDTVTVTRARPRAAEVLDLPGWRWLIDVALAAGEPGGGIDEAPPRAASGVSESFAAEVRSALLAAGTALAMLAARFDADAAVVELLGLPQATLIYGVLPSEVLTAAIAAGPAR